MLKDLEGAVQAGRALTGAEMERVAACPDLAIVGALGEAARRKHHGDRVTFLRVCEWNGEGPVPERGEAGEVRLKMTPESVDDARAHVRDAVRLAAGVHLTGFCLGALLKLVGGDHLALADMARALKAEGLDGVSEVPIDVLGDTENVVETVRAAQQGGLQTVRATVSRAPFSVRMSLIDTVAIAQRETGAFKAFAPLPQNDSHDQPSTGYDDVRTIALARLGSPIPSIQVDWPLYGPKLAQVAIAYGADDIDGVSAVESAEAGRRRSPREEIMRHIRMAFAEPVERDGRFDARP
jgi:2-iminoacetate synthase ThiH